MIFRSIQDFRQQIAQIIQEGKVKLEEVADQYQKDLESRLQNEVEGIKGWLGSEIATKVKENIFAGISTIKGETGAIGLKGDKGDSIRGETGPQGLVGVQGAKGEKGLAGKDGIDGKNGIDGKTPIKGIDYFTKKEQEQLMNKVASMIKFKPLEEKIKEILEKLEQMKRTQQLGGRTLLHGGSLKTWIAYSIGTGDGVTKAFTLPAVPHDTTQVLIHSGAITLPPLATNFSISGTTVTLVDAPPDGDNVAVTMQS